MSRKVLVSIVSSIFIAFGFMLSISISISTKDDASYIQDQQYDLEGRIERMERRMRNY